VETSNDQVDVLYSVKERPTGALLVGVGFSSVEKLAFSTSIQQSNAFGTGKFIAATINSGSVNKVYSLSYLDPYYTIDGVSQGFDVYKRRTDASQLTVAPYVTDSIGGGIKFGYPTSEITAIDFGVNFESVNLQTFDTSPLQYINFVSQFGNTYRYGVASAGWARDTRDNILQPKSGALSRVSSEFAGGDLQYYRLGFVQQWLHPLTRDYTLFLRGDVGYAAGLAGKPLPFFKSYFLGGPDSVRGYAGFSLGPQDINGNAVGGNRKVSGTAEFQFPMPGATREQSLRLGLFLDAGQVYAQGQKLALGDLRYSMGLGLQWISPFGPLRFSFAQPLRSRPTDHIQRIQFTFGTGF
jgi:outer membrane protein insertion porin family